MFTPIKIESTIKPDKFESLNNGVWYYNYDIVEKIVPTVDMTTEEAREEIRYEFLQVRINGKPTFSKCYSAILAQYKNEKGISLDEAENDADLDLIEDIHYNVRVDFGMADELSPLEREKNSVIRKIEQYDVSPEINSFYLNDNQVWLDKDTRVGLMNSLTIEKNAGKELSTLWFNDIKIEINVDAAMTMLGALELYALECYNKTAEHKVAVNALDTITEVRDYNYTIGYPEKLKFSI